MVLICYPRADSVQVNFYSDFSGYSGQNALASDYFNNKSYDVFFALGLNDNIPMNFNLLLTLARNKN